MAGTLFVEFVVPGRFHGGWNFPFIKGMLASEGLATRWLRFGLDASIQARRDEHGIGLDTRDETVVLQALHDLHASHVLFSAFPAPRLVEAIASTEPSIRMGVVDATRLSIPSIHDQTTRLGKVSVLDGTRIRPWFGLVAADSAAKAWPLLVDAPDYGYEPANDIARDLAPVVHIMTGQTCTYRRPLAQGGFWATGDRADIGGLGCAFCNSRRRDTGSIANHADARMVLRRQLAATVRTHPKSRHPIRYRMRGAPLAENPVELAQIVAESEAPLGSVLLDYRADRVVELAQPLRTAARILGDRGYRLEVCLVGIESFSAAQLDRYRKGFGPETNLRCIRVLRELEAELPVCFGYREHGGLLTILYDPWTTLGDLAINFAVVKLFGLEGACGKLLTSRLRLEPGLPLEVAARRDGLIVDTYSDSLFDTARRNFYSAEIPWEFADPRLKAVCQILVRLAKESNLAGDSLCQRIIGWERRTPEMSSSHRAAQIVEVASLFRHPVEPEDLLSQIERLSIKPPSPIRVTTRLDRTIEGGDVSHEINLNVSEFAFKSGVKSVIKLEEDGSERQIIDRELELKARWPGSIIQRRKPAWGADGEWELFASRDVSLLERATALAYNIETERDETLLKQSIVQMGQLLGYPTCCASAFAEAPTVYRTRNEWLWVRRRVDSTGRIGPEFNPILTSYVPCSLACEPTAHFVRTALGGVPWVPWGTLPTLLLLDRPGETIQLSFTDIDNVDPLSNTFRYEVKASRTSDRRLAMVRQGDTIVVEPGLIRILQGGLEIAFFALDAFLWCVDRAFYPDFWRQCLRQLEDPIWDVPTEASRHGTAVSHGEPTRAKRSTAFEPIDVQAPWRKQMRATLESILRQLATQSARPLRGFVLADIADVSTGRSWGKLTVLLQRGHERLHFFIQDSSASFGTFQSTKHLSLCFFKETPPDSPEKRRILNLVLNLLDKRIAVNQLPQQS